MSSNQRNNIEVVQKVASSKTTIKPTAPFGENLFSESYSSVKCKILYQINFFSKVKFRSVFQRNLNKASSKGENLPTFGICSDVTIYFLFIAIFLDNYVQGKRRKEVYGTHVKHQP